jgi:hypothetical protein
MADNQLDISVTLTDGTIIKLSDLFLMQSDLYHSSYMSGTTQISDINATSELKTLLYAMNLSNLNLIKESDKMLSQLYIDTATGNKLDKLGLEWRLFREMGNYAIGEVAFWLPFKPDEIPLGVVIPDKCDYHRARYLQPILIPAGTIVSNENIGLSFKTLIPCELKYGYRTDAQKRHPDVEIGYCAEEINPDTGLLEKVWKYNQAFNGVVEGVPCVAISTGSQYNINKDVIDTSSFLPTTLKVSNPQLYDKDIVSISICPNEGNGPDACRCETFLWTDGIFRQGREKESDESYRTRLIDNGKAGNMGTKSYYVALAQSTSLLVHDVNIIPNNTLNFYNLLGVVQDYNSLPLTVQEAIDLFPDKSIKVGRYVFVVASITNPVWENGYYIITNVDDDGNLTWKRQIFKPDDNISKNFLIPNQTGSMPATIDKFKTDYNKDPNIGDIGMGYTSDVGRIGYYKIKSINTSIGSIEWKLITYPPSDLTSETFDVIVNLLDRNDIYINTRNQLLVGIDNNLNNFDYKLIDHYFTSAQLANVIPFTLKISYIGNYITEDRNKAYYVPFVKDFVRGRINSIDQKVYPGLKIKESIENHNGLWKALETLSDIQQVTKLEGFEAVYDPDDTKIPLRKLTEFDVLDLVHQNNIDTNDFVAIIFNRIETES